ncbi:hypothetical protein IID62_05990 [candidate division KSB1 bacterium]|nr:hypothetical protein [candidate division KSB1 bacterium]
MKKLYLYIVIFLIVVMNITDVVSEYWTDFSMTIYITNKSDKTKELFLEKGRILELAEVNSTHIQSIIITSGDGLISIPPGQTVQRRITGICLNKGLRFPSVGREIVLTPFTGNEQLIQAGREQEAVHKITEFPLDNVALIIAKGYSDNKKDGRAKDMDEAFKAAVENAARESGFTFTSESILNNLKLIQTMQKLRVEEKSIKLNKVVHEEYNEDTGEYLYIGEFEVRSKPSKPEIQKQ